MNLDNCKAYTLIEKTDLKDLNSTGYLLEHNKTKARIALISNEDENKVFHIGFRTPPKDSTGVAHIVEHTVLCGSKEFPVKDPFIELAKGSLNTFLNAMTYPDKTVYPVASCNDKDFQNLMHVYLDAVFYPNIYREEKIFKQEGWHYELEDPDGELKYNGVVFNEMKGVFSSPDQLLFRNIQHSLFPDNAYGVESGGDPVEIPDLTYEAYLDFHRKYYHPSNSYIYLYGDMDMEEKMNWIDEHYLSHFEYLEVDSEIEDQPAFEEPREEYGFYSVTEDEETEGKAYFSYNVVCPGLDCDVYEGLRVLEHVLVNSVGAPIKQALLDAGIGTEISCAFEESMKQPWFSIIAKNVHMEQKTDFIRIIRETLEKLVKDGLNTKSLTAALNAMEFQYREADFGSYPKGLMYGLQMFDSWLYDAKQPFVHLMAANVYDSLRQRMDTGFFEDMIQRLLLDNDHRTFVSVEPQIGLTARMDEEEKQRLAKVKEKLTKEQIEDLIIQTAELKKYQEEPTSEEDLKCIPLLTRADIEKKARPYVNEVKSLEKIKTLHQNIFTNGINYIRISFDVSDLHEYAPYLGLFTGVIGVMDTDSYDKLELSNEILIHAGGYSCNTAAYEDRKTGEYPVYVETTLKVLYGETDYTLSLLKEMLLHTHLQDEKRLKEIIGETRSSLQISLQSAGHNTTVSRGMAYVKPRAKLLDNLKGINFYEFICDLDEHFEERKEDLICVLQGLVNEVFTKERMLIGITADDTGYDQFEKAMKKFLPDIPQKSSGEMPQAHWKIHEIPVNEGFKTASKVQYVARVGSYEAPYTGALKVVKTILSYDYLWNEVRVKGGAYGVMCDFMMNGTAFFTSYRDPNLKNTNEVYKGVPEYLKNFKGDERAMMKYIIGTVSGMDTPLTPRTAGERAYNAYLCNITWEDKQKERDEVLAADEEAIRKTATVVEQFLGDEYICALGSEENIQKEETLFDTISTLK